MEVLGIKTEVLSIKMESLWSFCAVFIRHSKNLNTHVLILIHISLFLAQ
ncbi:hypothetical protein MCETHM1_02558 [Flavobacteriaceae bacterium]